MNLSSDILPVFLHVPLLTLVPFSQTFQLHIFPPTHTLQKESKITVHEQSFYEFSLIQNAQINARFPIWSSFPLTQAPSDRNLLFLPIVTSRIFQHKSVVSTGAAAFQHLSLCSQLCYEVCSPQHSFFTAQILRNLCVPYL